MSESERDRPETAGEPPTVPAPASPDRSGAGHGPAPCRCGAAPFPDGVVELRKRRGPGAWNPAADPVQWLELLSRRAADRADRPRG
ncbi:hypothetical protein [Streptomyces sp. cmx-4-9]|uniref:hypothetical protein n=1 Tax=Streptomyces sp. cmx-4-9 TaxID=2790941 RepID=UPI0039812782